MFRNKVIYSGRFCAMMSRALNKVQEPIRSQDPHSQEKARHFTHAPSSLLPLDISTFCSLAADNWALQFLFFQDFVPISSKKLFPKLGQIPYSGGMVPRLCQSHLPYKVAKCQQPLKTRSQERVEWENGWRVAGKQEWGWGLGRACLGLLP